LHKRTQAATASLASIRDTDLVLRDFTDRDQLSVQKLILDGLRERWGDDYDDSFNEDVRDMTRNYLAHGADVVVVEFGQDIIATGTLLNQGDGRGRIVRMSVAGSHRRQGLARLVVAELVARAHGRGFHAVDVLTDVPWASAVALYLSCGFSEIGRDETDVHFTMDLSTK